MISSVDINGELVITEFQKGNGLNASIIETKEEIRKKNELYDARAKACVDNMLKQNERIALAQKRREEREKANQGK